MDADPQATGPGLAEPPPRPGWYPDPLGRFGTRWWDGSRWTEYADAGGGDVRWDPLPEIDQHQRVASPPGFAAAIVGFAGGVGLSLIGHLVFEGADEPGGRAAELLVSSVGLWLGLFSSCLYVSHRRGTGSIRRDFGVAFRWRDVGFGLAGSVGARLLVFAAVAVLPLPVPTRRIDEAEREVFGGASDTGLALATLLFITCIGAPLFEELFFRGLVQGRLVTRLGVAPGIALTSLLFGAAHVLAWDGAWTLVYAWAVAASGVVLGLMRHVSANLGTPMVAHAFFNAQAMAVFILLS